MKQAERKKSKRERRNNLVRRAVPTLQKLTRREWLTEIGETAAMFGLVKPSLAGELGGSRAASRRPQTKPLPPGLYAPLPNCLAQALETTGRYVRPPAGTRTDYSRPASRRFEPRFFTASEFKSVRRLVQVMLGAPSADEKAHNAKSFVQSCEDVARWIDLVVSESPAIREPARGLSPQHRNLAVHYYGAQSVERLENSDPQQTWRAGLAWLEEESLRQHHLPLARLRRSDLYQLLEDLSNPPSDKSIPQAAREFFNRLKAEVIQGYYTSPQGLRELDYKGNAFYAVSPGCPKGRSPRVTHETT